MPPPGDIIRVASKGKGGRRQIKNVFVDNRGYPDQTDDHNTLLHNIEKGHVLWKLWHPPPPIDKVDHLISRSMKLFAVHASASS